MREEEKNNFGSYNTEIFLQYLEIQGKLPFYKPQGDHNQASDETS